MTEAAMTGVGAPWEAMGSSPERGKRGEGVRERGAPWVGAAALLPARGYSACAVREKQAGEEEKREKKGREGKKRKGKIIGKNSKHGNFQNNNR
jgi:hypothetical protein